LSQEFAFSVGSGIRSASITLQHMPALANQLSMGQQFIQKLAHDLAQRIPEAVGQAVAEVIASLSNSAKLLAERLNKFVRTNTKKTAARQTT
jgi:serine/threonine-protein kinase HipA